MRIVMRDGFELTLTQKEFEQAAASSRFRTDVGRKDLLGNANQLYAAAAKRAQMEGNDGYGPNKMSYDRSLRSLEDGEYTSNVMEQVGRLGLSEAAKKVQRSEMKNYDSTLSSGAGHAYFVSNGDRDYYGKVGPPVGLFGGALLWPNHPYKGPQQPGHCALQRKGQEGRIVTVGASTNIRHPVSPMRPRTLDTMVCGASR